MSRICSLTGKKPTSGNNRPFSLKATKRTFRPNLFVKRIMNPFTGRMEKIKLSAKAIKTIKKWEREGMIGESNEVNQKTFHQETTKERVKKEKLTPKQKKELAAQKEAEAKESAKPEMAKKKEATEKTKKKQG